MLVGSDLRNIDLGFFTDEPLKEDEIEDSSGLPETCEICDKTLSSPVILNCLHIFDQICLSDFKVYSNLMEYIKCPKCGKISGELKSLEPYDTTVFDQNNNPEGENKGVTCSLCTEGKEAQYRCIQCAGTLCDRCRDTHKVMKLFSSHEVLGLSEAEKQKRCELQRTMQNAKPVKCTDHPGDVYSLFCVQCHVPLCNVCCETDHKGHITLVLSGVTKHTKSFISEGLRKCHENQNILRDTSDSLHSVLSDLSLSRDTNKTQIEELCNKWKSAIDSIKDELIQKNREIHSDIEMRLMTRINQLRKTVDHIDFVEEFCSSYLKNCSSVQVSKLVKPVLGCLDHLKSVNFPSDLPSKIIFNEVPVDVHELIRCNLGSFDLPSSHERHLSADYGIVAEKGLGRLNSYEQNINNALKNLDLKRNTSQIVSFLQPPPPLNLSETSLDNIRGSVNGNIPINAHRLDSMTCVTTNISPWGELGGFDNDSSVFSASDTPTNPMFMSQRIPMANDGLRSPSTLGSPSLDLESACLLSRQKLQGNYNASLYEYSRMRSARCSNMTLLTKWGSLGCDLSRMNSPHGFCLGFDEEIVVADTYNHRIQIFSKRGEFLSYFGVSGRVDGLLWYPRKVAIIRQSQRYVVCDRGNERSRMQLFSRSGHYVRRIQIKYIDIVAGLAINQHGHIVAIDSVTPSVFVMSEEGDLIRWFDCSNHMKEPSDVAIHGREYYICDFKAHCVVVFQEDGSFIRTIGGESVTDFPNGIDVSDHGDVLVGDSHGNRFHIAVFSSKGDLLSEFVCNQTKVSRSCCLKITTEGYVVTLARSSNNVLVMDTLYIS